VNAIKPTVKATDIVKLGAMECAASCLMTGLNIMGLDYRRFMLNYWHLTYFSNIIMSSKSAMQNNVDAIYGIKMELVTGSPLDIERRLAKRTFVMVNCQASKLAFFPSSQQRQEANAFHHYILLYGYDPKKERFLAVDPVVDYTGFISADELLHAGVKEGQLVYYQFDIPESPPNVPLHKLFGELSKKNYMLYTNSEFQNGVRALELLQRDLMASMNWQPDRRQSWIDMNMITITSIIKARALAWTCLQELSVLREEDRLHGGPQIDRIVKLWTTVNFLMIKLKRSPAEPLFESIRQKMDQIRQAEVEFLKFLYEKGREGLER